MLVVPWIFVWCCQRVQFEWRRCHITNCFSQMSKRQDSCRYMCLIKQSNYIRHVKSIKTSHKSLYNLGSIVTPLLAVLLCYVLKYVLCCKRFSIVPNYQRRQSPNSCFIGNPKQLFRRQSQHGFSSISLFSVLLINLFYQRITIPRLWY